MEGLIQVGQSPRHTRRGMVRGSLTNAATLPPLSADNLATIDSVMFFGADETETDAPPAVSISRPPALLARMREFLLQERRYDNDYEDYGDGDYGTDDFEVGANVEPSLESLEFSAADGNLDIQSYGPGAGSVTDDSAPHVELMPDGHRVETFACGGWLTKDVLGRVTEVRSAQGETLWLRYSPAGKLESFVRTDSRGRTHSRGELDKHGVVVRDPEGRVRASGVSMTVDPRGCFYLHTQDAQFFAIDLIGGFHVERRMAAMQFCRDKYITAFFGQDGFRMATKVACQSTDGGGARRTCGFRFYGRDGTMLEFKSYDHVKVRRPAKVLPPGSFPINSSWRRQRQGNTAWHSVQQYLSRASN